MQNVTLRQLRVFAAVARELSFSRAANELHLTQPAVSMQVRQLEEAAGMALFERIGRRIALTEAGQELLAGASSVDEQLRRTGESIDGLRGMKSGTLKLGAVSTAKYFAPSLIGDFTRDHAGVTVRFNIANRENVIALLGGNEIDLAIMGRPPRELATIAEPFAKHPLVIIAAPDHPLAGKRRIPLRRLESENFLIREEGSGTRASLERVFKDRGARYRASMEVSSNETIKQAVIAGLGLSFLSIHTVGLELQAGKLVTLDVAGLPVMRDWFVIHLRNKRLSPIASAFREFLIANGAAIIERATGVAASGDVRGPIRFRQAPGT